MTPSRRDESTLAIREIREIVGCSHDITLDVGPGVKDETKGG